MAHCSIVAAKEPERVCSRRITHEAEKLIRLWRPDTDLASVLQAFNLEKCRCAIWPESGVKASEENDLPQVDY
jgi:hypothetical protein